jgi:hypothetical protein
MSAERFPLSWPAGRPRTQFRTHSRFKTGWQAAIDALTAELARLGGNKLVDTTILSTNVSLRLDGQPRGTAARQVSDPGVAVYFSYKGREVCFACDRWTLVHDNIYAVAKTIEAMRGIARWGTGEMLDAAFRGFAALPPKGQRPWRELLGPGSLADVELRFRELARKAHPDVGGSHDQMAELNVALAAARAELS